MSAGRSRILLITRNLPPLVGGMERLNWHMAEELAKVAEVHVIGPQGAAALAPAGIAITEIPLKPLWKFFMYGWITARREARRLKPNIVLAGSGLTAPLALAGARTCGARAYTYVHGLDVAVRHPIYKLIWLRALRAMHGVIANSGPTRALCRDIGIPDEVLGIVHPGVDLPPPVAASDFRVRQFGDRPLLLSVGRLSTRKGLREFVAEALPAIVAKFPDVLLLIVGDAPTQALHAQAQTRESIQVAADAAGVGENIRFLGVITDYQELGQIYRSCDLHVFPVRGIPGDPEGFGMVAVEAAAHGLPTVAFATGGVVDAVSENHSGYLVSQGDYVAFANAVNRVLATPAQMRDSCQAFARRFEWPEFGRRVMVALQMQGSA